MPNAIGSLKLATGQQHRRLFDNDTLKLLSYPIIIYICM